MARKTSTSLRGPFIGFIGRKVAEGRSASASDVVRARLRYLEEAERHVGDLSVGFWKSADETANTRSAGHAGHGSAKVQIGRHVVSFREAKERMEVVRVL